MTTQKKKRKKKGPSRLGLRLRMTGTAPKLPPTDMCARVIRLQQELVRAAKEENLQDVEDLEDVLQVHVFEEIARTLASGGMDMTEVLNTVRGQPRFF